MSQIKNKWNRIPKGIKIVFYVILGIIGAIFLGIVFGYVIMLLWNWLMPELFNLKEITYWQAIGIFVLAKIIFGFGGSSESKGKNKECKDNEFAENNEFGENNRVSRNKQESKSWMYYDEWWNCEGEKEFEDFIEKRNENILDDK